MTTTNVRHSRVTRWQGIGMAHGLSTAAVRQISETWYAGMILSINGRTALDDRVG